MASKKKAEERTGKQSLVLYVHDLVYMLSAVMLIFLIFFRVIVVTQNSMFDTLWDGDYLLLGQRGLLRGTEAGGHRGRQQAGI